MKRRPAKPIISAPPYRGKPLATREHLHEMYADVLSDTADAITLHFRVTGDTWIWRRVPGTDEWFEQDQRLQPPDRTIPCVPGIEAVLR